jgi:hypothetical protein
MKKPGVLPVLAALELVAIGLFGLFWFRMRPELTAMYAGAPLPWATGVALSSWLAPLVTVGGALGVLAALVGRGPMRRRMALAGAGLVVTAFGLAFALFAAYSPAFASGS